MNALGLASNRLVLQPHNSEWAQLFEEESARLRSTLKDFVLDIQHVGSTSIPGIPAKPILDIAIAVADFEEAKRCIALIEALGYTYRGEQGIPQRHYFVKGMSDARTHHLHMNEVHSSDWQQQIAFRDTLRQHADLAQAYAALKLRLAEQFPTDRAAYTEAKSGFISRVLNRALPALLPNVGELITVRAYKRDATWYRSWQATVTSVGEEEVVTFDPPGRLVTDRSKGDWQSKVAIRGHYWFDRPYNLLEVYHPNGELGEIYAHIASPMVVKNGEILYTDYELDVVKPAGGVATVVDEEEFIEATARFGYSAEFCQHCWQTARELVSLVDHYQPAGPPNHWKHSPP